MLERTKKLHIDSARFVGSTEKLQKLRNYASTIGIMESVDSIPWREVFPEFKGNEVGTMLSGYRLREGLTQMQLAALTGIPQRHISEMERGKRSVGKERSKKLAEALHCDYRGLL